MEKCTKCGHEYLRDYDVCTALGVHSHITGTAADTVCCVLQYDYALSKDGSVMTPSAVASSRTPSSILGRIFQKVSRVILYLIGAYSHDADTLETSFDHASKADLCMAMGSSLTVTPAANIPEVCV